MRQRACLQVLVPLAAALWLGCSDSRSPTDAGQPRSGPAVFLVRACEGSGHAPAGELFRVLIVDPVRIAEAESYRQSGESRMIAGIPVAGDGGINPGWSWHLRPDTIRFPEVVAGTCSTCPIAVEADVPYWVDLGCFAPSVHVVSRER